MMDLESALSTLGLKPGASRTDIRQKFQSLSKSLHPDKGGSGFLFGVMKDAYDYALDNFDKGPVPQAAAKPAPSQPQAKPAKPKPAEPKAAPSAAASAAELRARKIKQKLSGNDYVREKVPLCGESDLIKPRSFAWDRSSTSYASAWKMRGYTVFAFKPISIASGREYADFVHHHVWGADGQYFFTQLGQEYHDEYYDRLDSNHYFNRNVEGGSIVGSPSVSPGGKKVACAIAVNNSISRAVLISNTSGHENWMSPLYSSDVVGMTWSPNGKRLAIGYQNGGGDIVDVSNPTFSEQRMTLLDDPTRVVMGNRWGARNSSSVYFHNASERQEHMRRDVRDGGRGWYTQVKQMCESASFNAGTELHALAWSPDATKLALGVAKGINIVDVDSMTIWDGPKTAGNPVKIAWSADSHRLLAHADNDVFHVFSVTGSGEVKQLASHFAVSASWSADGYLAIFVDEEQSFFFASSEDGKIIGEGRKPHYGAKQVALSPNGLKFVMENGNNEIINYDFS